MGADRAVRSARFQSSYERLGRGLSWSAVPRACPVTTCSIRPKGIGALSIQARPAQKDLLEDDLTHRSHASDAQSTHVFAEVARRLTLVGFQPAGDRGAGLTDGGNDPAPKCIHQPPGPERLRSGRNLEAGVTGTDVASIPCLRGSRFPSGLESPHVGKGESATRQRGRGPCDRGPASGPTPTRVARRRPDRWQGSASLGRDRYLRRSRSDSFRRSGTQRSW